MNVKRLKRFSVRIFYIFIILSCIFLCYTEARVRGRRRTKFRRVTPRMRRFPYYDIHRSNQITFCDNPRNANTKACNHRFQESSQETSYYDYRKERRPVRNHRRNERNPRKQNKYRDKSVKKRKPFEPIITPITGQFKTTSDASPKLNQFADSFRDWSDKYTSFHLRVISDTTGDRYSVDSSNDEFDYNPKNLQCPSVPHLETVHCSPKYSVDQCWVPDQPDSKCGNGLCCFDGCRNVCFGGVQVENDDEDQDNGPYQSNSGGGVRYKRKRKTHQNNPRGNNKGHKRRPSYNAGYINGKQKYRRYKRKNSGSNGNKNENPPSSSQYDAPEEEDPKENKNQYDNGQCPARRRRRYRRQSDCKNSKPPNCWSAGTYDLDCPNSGLCCFDGCVNRCVDEPEDELSSYGQSSVGNSPSYRPQSSYKNPEDIPNNYAKPVKSDKEEKLPNYGSSSSGPTSTSGYGGETSGPSSYDSSGTGPGVSNTSPGYEEAEDPLDPLDDPLDQGIYGNDGGSEYDYSSNQDYSGPSGSDTGPSGYNTLGQVTGNFQFDFPIFGNNDVPSEIGEVLSNTYSTSSSGSGSGGYKLTTTAKPSADTNYRLPIQSSVDDSPPKQNSNEYSAPNKAQNNPYGYGGSNKKQSNAVSKVSNEKPNSGPVVVLHIYSKDGTESIAAYNHVGDFSNSLKLRAKQDKELENEGDRIILSTKNSKSNKDTKEEDERRKRKTNRYHELPINTKQKNKRPKNTFGYKPASTKHDNRNILRFQASIKPQHPKRCPFIGRKSSVECQYSASAECENPNVNDSKCHKGGLCCFDGCTFRCIENVETQVRRRSYEIEEGSEPNVYDPNKNLGVCKKEPPLPSHMCRLRFVHECHSVGRSSDECPEDKSFCCFDGCINSCVDVYKTTLSLSQDRSNSRSGHEDVKENVKDTFDLFTHPTTIRHPRLHSVEDEDLMGNIHGALYDFFMGENSENR